MDKTNLNLIVADTGHVANALCSISVKQGYRHQQGTAIAFQKKGGSF